MEIEKPWLQYCLGLLVTHWTGEMFFTLGCGQGRDCHIIRFFPSQSLLYQVKIKLITRQREKNEPIIKHVALFLRVVVWLLLPLLAVNFSINYLGASKVYWYYNLKPLYQVSPFQLIMPGNKQEGEMQSSHKQRREKRIINRQLYISHGNDESLSTNILHWLQFSVGLSIE